MAEEPSVNEIVVPARPEIYPDSRAKESKGVRWLNGMNWVPLFCANCGADRGWVPEDSLNCNFAFALCDPCAEKWSPLTDTYLVPDYVFWENVKKEQLERYGRELTGPEVVEALKDDNHFLSKMAKDRPKSR